VTEMLELEEVAEISINNILKHVSIQKQIEFYEEQYKYCGLSSERILSLLYKAFKNQRILQEYEEADERCRAAAFILHMLILKELDEVEIGHEVPVWIMKGLAVFARRFGYDFFDIYSEFESLASQFVESLSVKSTSKDFALRKYSKSSAAQLKQEARSRAYFSLEEKLFLRIPIDHAFGKEI
jgi:hypothetical protein